MPTLAEAIVPMPPATEQLSPVGCVCTLTLKVVPELSPEASATVLAPLATGTAVPFTDNTSPELLRPETLPLRL